MSKNLKGRKTYWLPPKGASAYFLHSSDEDFKRKHPWGYFFLVILGLIALFSPIIAFVAYTQAFYADNGWIALGWLGSFIVGIGLFNFVAIIIKQYLGHLVSILSFLIGGIMIAFCLYHI